jgi:uncharacterized protein (TIGR02598 family)
MQRSRSTRAFSLVEVVIAMGIAAVSLVTALGLLGASLNSQDLSANDTVLVSMTEHVLSDLRNAPFDTLWDEQPGGVAPASQPMTEPLNTRYYFSREGDLVEETDFRAYYECVVVKTRDETTRSPKLGPYNLLKLELSFNYPKLPANASANPNQRSLYASIARY